MESLAPGTKINNEYVVKSKLHENDSTSSYVVGYRGDNKNYYLKLYKTRNNSDINIDIQYHKDLPPEFEYKIYQAGTYNGYPFFVRNFFPGRTLKEYVEERVLQEDEIFDIFQCIYKKINLMHSVDKVHFDLKPSNIIVKKHLGVYDVKLIDFNCIDPLKTNRDIRNIFSTLQFAAPEFILANDVEHPFMCDYYSLGAVLFFMLFKSAPINPKDLVSYVPCLKKFNLREHLQSIKDERIKTNLQQLLIVDPADRYASSYVNNILPIITRPQENFDATTIKILAIIKYSKFADDQLLLSLTAALKDQLDSILTDLKFQGVVGNKGKYYITQLKVDLPQSALSSVCEGIFQYNFREGFVDHTLLANAYEVRGNLKKSLYHWQKSAFCKSHPLTLVEKGNVILHLIKDRVKFQLNDRQYMVLMEKSAEILSLQGEFNKAFHIYKRILSESDRLSMSPATLIKLHFKAADSANASRKPNFALDHIKKALKLNTKSNIPKSSKYIENGFLLRFLMMEVKLLYVKDIPGGEFLKLFSYLKYDFLKKFQFKYITTIATKYVASGIVFKNSSLANKYGMQMLSLRNELNSNLVRGVYYHTTNFPLFHTHRKGLNLVSNRLNRAFSYYSQLDIAPYYPLASLNMLAFVNVVRGKHDELFSAAKYLGQLNIYAKSNFGIHATSYMDYFNSFSQLDSKGELDDNTFSKFRLENATLAELSNWYYLKSRITFYRGDLDQAFDAFYSLKSVVEKTNTMSLWYKQFMPLLHADILFKAYGSLSYSRGERLRFLKKLKKLKPVINKLSKRIGIRANCFRLLAKYEMIEMRRDSALDYLDKAIQLASFQDFPIEEALSCIEKSRILRDSYPEKAGKALERGVVILKKNRLNLIIQSFNCDFAAIESTADTSGMKMQERLILDKIKLIQEKTSIIKDEEQLLREILDTAIETLNGERGVLILRSKENPEKYDFAMARDCFKNTISDYSGNISRNILYNASLSDDPTILEDAALADDFSKYKSVRLNKLKSVLTIPLIYKGDKKGILYIDNNEIPGIFNEDIIELSKHFAISVCSVLENLERVKTIAELNNNVELINQKFIDSSELFTLGKIHPLTMHDLKSYLSYILFGIDDLKEELKKRSDGNDEFLAEIIDRLKNSVSVINKHINSNNALVSRGRTIDFESLSSDYILDDIMEFISPFSEKDKIEVQFINNIEHPVTFTGNRYLLNNVFINILINALDALRIPMESSKLIRVEMDRSDYTIVFRISNNGPPVDENIRGKIFSPFMSSKKSSSSNSGLGLYISEKIMEYHKGEIYLDDKHEMTSFVMELTLDG